MCPAGGERAGNPILPATAEKYRSELDFVETGPAPLSFVRFYRSNRGLDAARSSGALGKGWTHNYEITLKVVPATATLEGRATVTSAEGYARNFTQALGSTIWVTANGVDTFSQSAGGWTWKRAENNSSFVYQRHDICYVACGSNTMCRSSCDKSMVEELQALPDDPTKWPSPPRLGTESDSRQYRNSAIGSFRR
jgi:hypothetical protein